MKINYFESISVYTKQKDRFFKVLLLFHVFFIDNGGDGTWGRMVKRAFLNPGYDTICSKTRFLTFYLHQRVIIEYVISSRSATAATDMKITGFY